MGRCDKVDVMAAEFLKKYHDTSQVFIFNFLAIAFMGYGPVLAKNTAKITVREKNGTRSVLSNQRYFLTKMGVGRIDHEFGRCPAETQFALLTINSTLSGAKFALLEDRVSLLYPLSQFTFLLQFPIGGIPSSSCFFCSVKKSIGDEK
jgi:hypothetical protein